MGCVIYELLLGSHPFTEDSSKEVFQLVLSRKYQLLNVSSECSDFLSQLLQFDLLKRFQNSRDLLQHNYISVSNILSFDLPFIYELDCSEGTGYFVERVKEKECRSDFL